MRRRPPPADPIPEVPARLRHFRYGDWTAEGEQPPGGDEDRVYFRDDSIPDGHEPSLWQYQQAHQRFLAARRAWEQAHGVTLEEVWRRLEATGQYSLEALSELYGGPLFIDSDDPDPRWPM